MQDQQKSDAHRETEREKFTYNFFVWEINLYLWTINVTSKQQGNPFKFYAAEANILLIT